jgi:hypothetical protein
LIVQSDQQPTDLLSLPDHSLTEFRLGGQTLTVEVVNTPESITQGLAGRESWEADGMLFVFDQPAQPVFWMKGMVVPIDIIWLTDGQIVGIERNVQAPESGTPDDQLARFPAPQVVDMVLETAPYLIED